jgi:uncharacterized protein (DUF1501 family)
MNSPSSRGRRDFLRKGGLAALAGASPFALSLFGAAAASAQSASDYKALVCVFLLGGNDQSNTLVPTSASEYGAYQRARPALALPPSSLIGLSPAGYSGPPLGLHPSLGALEPMFRQGRLAVVPNLGCLIVPTTRAQWNGGRPDIPVPYQLFSHSDQIAVWQAGVFDRPVPTGWLGRMADLLDSAYNPTSGVSMSMSIAGNNALQVGANTVQYQLNAQGAVRVNALTGLYGSATNGQAVRRLLTQSANDLFGAELNRIGARAIDTEVRVSSALAGSSMTTAFPDTGLGRQLRMVARMIAARSLLGQRRQVFYVAQGGYDFHDNLLNDQATRLRELGDALAAFHRATEDLGVANAVTTFTGSEFGRALQSNGRGSDHGWGGHQFVFGGSVLGGRLYGAFPTVALGGPEDAGQGRLIPTTSIDEFASTLVRWFGVSSSDLTTVLPNIQRFARPNLGFLG